MFSKKLSLTLALALMMSFPLPYGAFALNYSGSQGNSATFETLEETRASSPAAVAPLETNNGKSFKSHPVLDGYPQGTTYVYRSPNLFGGRAAAKLNTNILVFAEKSFQKAWSMRSIQSMQRLCGVSPSIIPGIRRQERSNTIHIKNRELFSIVTL